MLALLLLSVALSMDAVAVALVTGATGKRQLLHGVELSVAFGLAQGLMPLIGYALGEAAGKAIEAYDHWIAFGLLALLGLLMLKEAFSSHADEDGVHGNGRHRYVIFAGAAIATSIDAAAAGLALPLLEVPVAISCATIGLTTAILSFLAYWLGSRASPAHRRMAEALGGIVLIGIGVKILVEHTGGFA